MTFAHRVELDAVIGELLARSGHVFWVTREPVERFAADDVNFARFHRAQQQLQSWAIVAISAATLGPRLRVWAVPFALLRLIGLVYRLPGQ